MNIKEIIKHFRTQAQSRFNPSPDGSREAYYNGRKDAYNDCADILERYAVKYPNGWHPASELPPVDRNGNSKLTVVIDDNGLPNCAYFHSDNLAKFWVKAGDWNIQQPILSVKWWCYPPKEE